jgi:hypothetical protein
MMRFVCLHGKITLSASVFLVMLVWSTTAPVTAQQAGKTIRDTYPLSIDKIKTTLADLSKPPAGDNPIARERAAALQRLKAYRFLSSVPYENLKLDDSLNDYTTAAAKICEKLKKLDHNPPNPGLPEEEYKKALIGAQKSNLGVAFPKANLLMSVDLFMCDSDPGNIALLGHRRWCLNPYMGKTGFGTAGSFSAMWSVDFSNKTAVFDYICYPAKGFQPVEYFGQVGQIGKFIPAGYAWSVMLNPQKYTVPKDEALDVKIFPIDLDGKKTGQALALNHKAVNRNFVATPLCLIFRPDKSAVAAGKRYQVEITGVSLKNGKATNISYPVEFVSVDERPMR